MRTLLSTPLAAIALILVLAATGSGRRVAPGADSATRGERALAAALLAAPDEPMEHAEMMALALREASRLEARAAFWQKMAQAVNDAPESLEASVQEALQALDEDMALADVQFDARLDLHAVLGLGCHAPVVDPAEFSADVTNPLFPLVPGRTLVYERMTAGGLEHIEMTTSTLTTLVAGVPCRVVRELEFLDGVLVEDTENWYSQKSDGSVWYFGELSKHWEEGVLVDIDGSWRAGRDGARPGLAMPAAPVPGQAYRQEFHLNGSEDFARVVSLGNTVTLASGPATGCVEILESTPLEPTERERKFFAPSVGLVREVDLDTGEVLDLVQIID